MRETMVWLKRSLTQILIAAFFSVLPAPIFAYNFLYIHPTTGEPITWEAGTTIEYWLDPGPLGQLTNDQAHTLLQEAMKIWEDASPHAVVPHFEFAGYLPEDVDGSNYEKYVSLFKCYTDDLDACPSEAQKNLQTVIVFDEDQSFLNNLCITGCGFAIAGARTFEGNLNNPTFIRQGIMVIGSSGGDANTLINALVGRMVHELGHILGLAHTSLNQEAYINDLSGFEIYIPTMFFSFAPKSEINRQSTLATLSADDIVGISNLYPTSTFNEQTATIKGEILKSDGSPMMHVNVIARSIDDPLCKAYSFLSGRSCEFATTTICEEAQYVDPTYTISGIPPDTYTVEVEEVADSNLALTLAPGLVNAYIYGDAEFWNEGDTASENHLTSSIITVSAGELIENIDIVLNRSEVTEDRLQFIPLDTYSLGTGELCPEEPEIDYAALIGIDEGLSSENQTTSTSGGCSLIR